jgi:hypothetical protein
MLPMTRWFGVTFSDDERSLEAETACVDEIVERVLQMQAQAAARQRRLARSRHARQRRRRESQIRSVRRR